MLALLDALDQRLDVEGVLAKRPRRDLPMKDARRNVGIVSGRLAPADRARVGGHAHEAHELIGEGLEAGDLHVAAVGAGAAGLTRTTHR